MRSTGVVFVMLLVASVPAFAQGGAPGQTAPPVQPLPAPPNPNNPQRMPARPTRPGELPPKGTAVIKGRVTSGGTGTAVRRAQVRAMSMEGRGGGVTSTDNNGLFEIKDLPAGR
ncbi:MAG TPA: carboxypeptidase-like regulatory domain-containing protein, partial [Vicinamibacterales bacterium]|nr:carboxypeptidase-like regulatory domain-containing protein [Vicinamibacterales bacterium]